MDGRATHSTTPGIGAQISRSLVLEDHHRFDHTMLTIRTHRGMNVVEPFTREDTEDDAGSPRDLPS